MLKFVMVDSGDSYRTGEILNEAGPGFWFVQFDNMGTGGQIPVELVSLDEMTVFTAEGLKAWSFFGTAAKRQEWLDWLDTPAKPKVVNLVKK